MKTWAQWRTRQGRVVRQWLGWGVGLLWLGTAAGTGWSASAERRPNVVLILTDDQGTVDANCYGASDLVTPSMDRLAREGVRFTQFYAAAPICSASRAGLLTGRFPVRAGVPNNVGSHRGAPGLPGVEVTLAEMFQAAGYATAHIGKWHLGHVAEHMPNAQGFDHSFGHMGGCIDNYSHFFYWDGPDTHLHDLYRNGLEVHEDGQFFGDLMLREARIFVQENRGRPFFMYYAMNMPHYPYQGEVKWLEHYRALPEPRRLYAAFLSTMDERIGRLLSLLDALGLRQQTMVVVQSDHGHSVEARARGGGGHAGVHRGAKGSLFEGGLRVPAILAWPGHLPAGEVRHQVAHSCDWMPTLAELCGIKRIPAGLDGRSLVPVLRSAEAPSPHGVLHWQLGNPEDPAWAVRRGPWKLLYRPNDNAGPKLDPADRVWFLANIEEDPAELVNQARARPDLVEALRGLRGDLETELGAAR